MFPRFSWFRKFRYIQSFSEIGPQIQKRHTRKTSSKQLYHARPCYGYTMLYRYTGWLRLTHGHWVLRLLLRSQQVPNVKSVGSSMSASFGTRLKHKVWKCLKKQAAYPGNMIVWSSIFPSKELHWSLIWLQVTSGRQKVLVGCKGPVEFQLESQGRSLKNQPVGDGDPSLLSIKFCGLWPVQAV
jgi:hypothetical protein